MTGMATQHGGAAGPLRMRPPRYRLAAPSCATCGNCVYVGYGGTFVCDTLVEGVAKPVIEGWRELHGPCWKWRPHG